MKSSVRRLALLSLALCSLAAQAQNSPATPPTTMPQTAPPSYSPPDAMPNAVADAAITTTLSSDFGQDSQLAPLKLNVASSEGNVSVHGIVPSDELRDRAMALASRVRGVKSVEDDLIVQP
jgi:osmotically-inducible protein OsmY